MIDDLPTVSVATDADPADPVDPAASDELHEQTHVEPPDRSVRAHQYVVVAVIVALARWWFARDRVVFHLAPDEPAQLAIARTISGGPHWNLFDSITYRPGYGTLVSPVFLFTDDGVRAYHAVIVIGAVLAGVSATLLLWLVGRLSSLSSWTCAVVAVIVAVAPTSIATTAYVWSEPLVTLTFVGTVCLLIRFRDRDRSLGFGIAAVACAVAGFTTHSRLLPVVATTLVLVCGSLLWAKRWVGAGVVAAFGLIATGASVAYHRWVLSTVWEAPASSNTAGSVIKRLEDPPAVLETLVGQLWYQLIATIGFAVIGSGVVLHASVPRRIRGWRPARWRSSIANDGPADGSSGRLDAWSAQVLVLTTGPLVFLSATFMSNRERGDQMIYGRYNDGVMWPIVAVGLVWMLHRARRGVDRRIFVALGAVTGVAAVLGVAVHAWHGDTLADDIGLGPMVPGLLPYIGTTDTASVATVTASAIVLLALAMLASIAIRLDAPSRRPALIATRAIVSIALIALLTFGATRVDAESSDKRNAWERASSVDEVRDLVPVGTHFGVRFVRDNRDPAVGWIRQRQRLQLYQYYLPDYAFTLDRGLDDGIGPFVFGPADDPGLIDAGAIEVWREPGEKISLWREPEPRSG